MDEEKERICRFEDCEKAGKPQPIAEFSIAKNRKSGKKYRRRECRTCFNKRHKKWRDANREHVRKTGRETMRRLRDEMIPSRKVTYRAYSAARQAARRAKFKALVYEHYGDHCVECGEDDLFCLSIDHKNNDGYQMRKSGVQNTAQMYEWLVKNEFPPDYQVLCMNCQHRKARRLQMRKESSTVIPGEGVGSS